MSMGRGSLTRVVPEVMSSANQNIPTLGKEIVPMTPPAKKSPKGSNSRRGSRRSSLLLKKMPSNSVIRRNSYSALRDQGEHSDGQNGLGINLNDISHLSSERSRHQRHHERIALATDSI